jgi:hypothetical protein
VLTRLRTAGVGSAATDFISSETPAQGLPGVNAAALQYMRDNGARGLPIGGNRLLVNNRDTVRFAADSTTIVMIDQTGGSGAPPRVASVISPLIPLSMLYESSPAPADSAQARGSVTPARRIGALTTYLESIPIVRAFVTTSR